MVKRRCRRALTSDALSLVQVETGVIVLGLLVLELDLVAFTEGDPGRGPGGLEQTSWAERRRRKDRGGHGRPRSQAGVVENIET